MKEGEYRGWMIWAVILGWILTASAAQAESACRLNYATFFPATHTQARLAMAWGDEIEKRTEGKVRFTYFTDSSLLEGRTVYDGVAKGSADVGLSLFGYTRGRFPCLEALDLPLGYPDAATSTAILNAFHQRYGQGETGQVKVLYLFAHGPGLLLSKKPVHQLSDVKGLKVRCTGTNAALSQALGAVPVAMPQDQTYDALMKGVVAATWSPAESLKTFNQAEVVNYILINDAIAYTQCFFVAMNLERWNALPQDVQAVFEAVSGEWVAKSAEAWDRDDAEGRLYALALGNREIVLDPYESARWQAAADAVIADYVAAAERNGLPGREYVAFIQTSLAQSRNRLAANE